MLDDYRPFPLPVVVPAMLHRVLEGKGALLSGGLDSAYEDALKAAFDDIDSRGVTPTSLEGIVASLDDAMTTWDAGTERNVGRTTMASASLVFRARSLCRALGQENTKSRFFGSLIEHGSNLLEQAYADKAATRETTV